MAKTKIGSPERKLKRVQANDIAVHFGLPPNTPYAKIAEAIGGGEGGPRKIVWEFYQANKKKLKSVRTDRVEKRKEYQKAYFEQPQFDGFLTTYAWRKVRMMALKASNGRCECCGASPKDGIVLHVDHIKPRRLFPELALEVTNLQVLCEACNHGKGNWDMTDWREARA